MNGFNEQMVPESSKNRPVLPTHPGNGTPPLIHLVRRHIDGGMLASGTNGSKVPERSFPYLAVIVTLGKPPADKAFPTNEDPRKTFLFRKNLEPGRLHFLVANRAKRGRSFESLHRNLLSSLGVEYDQLIRECRRFLTTHSKKGKTESVQGICFGMNKDRA
jgi:hypothetical protein